MDIAESRVEISPAQHSHAFQLVRGLIPAFFQDLEVSVASGNAVLLHQATVHSVCRSYLPVLPCILLSGPPPAFQRTT